MGATGPCGPCSEIHYDKGELSSQANTYKDPILGVNGKNERYVEIWNLVFMQNERKEDGTLKNLLAKHVDTGAGLERLCSIIQGKSSNYETDLFAPIISTIERKTNKKYNPDNSGTPHRVLADHIRALSFAIADGVTPGNEEEAML